jgi:hypothetical protein
MADFKKRHSDLSPPSGEAEMPAHLTDTESVPSDRRSARATGRTRQLATRVREEFHTELKMYAAKHRLKLVEVLEQGHEALKASKKHCS